MPILNLRSVEAKLRRSHEHAEAFARETDAWFRADAYRLVCESTADNTRHAIIAKLNPERPPNFERWSVIFADAIHNLRSALDHLVVAIAERQITPWPPPDTVLKSLSFVIADTPDQWRADSGRTLQLLHDDVRTAMEFVQPYRRGNDYSPPYLALLRDFTDCDKHRLLALRLTSPMKTLFNEVTWYTPDNHPSIVGHDGPIEDGTELAVLTFRRPEPKMQIDFRSEVTVTIGHAPGPKGHTRVEASLLLTQLLRPEVEEVIRIVAASVS